MKKLKHLKQAVIATAFAAVSISSAGVSHASDQQTTAVSRIELARSDVPGTDLETRLYLIVYPPGAAAPVHHHPVEGIGYIVEGTARSAFGTDAPVTLATGQGFHDKANIAHTIFENTDAQKPLKFIIAYTVQKGAPVLETP